MYYEGDMLCVLLQHKKSVVFTAFLSLDPEENFKLLWSSAIPTKIDSVFSWDVYSSILRKLIVNRF